MDTCKTITDRCLLAVSSARKSFGRVEVLKGVDLSIKSGERVALMGPSGSGKSTLLNCISGIEELDEGQISLDGVCISELNRTGIEKMKMNQSVMFFNLFIYSPHSPHLKISNFLCNSSICRPENALIKWKISFDLWDFLPVQIISQMH